MQLDRMRAKRAHAVLTLTGAITDTSAGRISPHLPFSSHLSLSHTHTPTVPLNAKSILATTKMHICGINNKITNE